MHAYTALLCVTVSSHTPHESMLAISLNFSTPYVLVLPVQFNNNKSNMIDNKTCSKIYIVCTNDQLLLHTRWALKWAWIFIAAKSCLENNLVDRELMGGGDGKLIKISLVVVDSLSSIGCSVWFVQTLIRGGRVMSLLDDLRNFLRTFLNHFLDTTILV